MTEQSAKIAIVGMDAFFGECNGLDAFERSIYDGTQHFISLPPKRWQGIEDQENLLKKYDLPEGKAPVGAYIKDFEIDTLAYKIPPNEVEKLNPQQLLLLKVADRALKDAQIKEGENVAVIIAAETELSVHQLQQRWDFSWQIKDGLNAGEISLPAEKVTQLETIVKDGLHHQVEIGEYLSYIGNIMASRISSLWNFSGPSFTITAVENSALKALEVAEMLLTSGEVDTVLVGAVDLAGGVENVLLRSQLAKINTGVPTLSYDQKADGWMVGEGAGAVVLKRHDTALEKGDRIYAVVDALSFGQGHYNATQLNSGIVTADTETVNSVCKQAFQIAGIEPKEISYLEVYGSGVPQEDEAEITGLLQAYPPTGDGLDCAIGSVKANIGHTFVASGIASLIKTALCLYHRYIPGCPKWSGVKTPQVWQGSPFYVATESRPWFLGKESTRRVAAINSMGIDGTFAHVILSEQPNQKERDSTYLQQTPFYLFPITASDRTELLEHLTALQQSIEKSTSLSTTASNTFTTFKENPQAKYALSILGRNKKELTREIESARKGVNNAFEKDIDWLTPAGSYFTAKPLGKHGGIAYVYPAAVNAYVGLGRNLFRLFPKVHNDEIVQSLYKRAADVEKLVFPRSLNKLTTRQLETLEKQLLDDSLALFEAEMLHTRLTTTIIQDDFQIKPKFVFGYSLGETSMMVAQGIWSNFYQGSNNFNSSPLFGERLSGAKNAVREYWGLPKAVSNDNNFWSNYVLIASASQVQECIKNENRVYLTQINTPEEVVIAGETAACERVIRTLGCDAFRAPFDHVIHCEPMQSEYEELVKVNTLTTSTNLPDATFYSALEHKPIVLESQAIAHSVAKVLCSQLDFLQLVNQVYSDGAKIFIEAGAGSVCSRWIDKILDGKEHLTVSLNRRGVDDHTSFVKALAKLVSHRVELDLSPLYIQAKETTRPGLPTIRNITLGGKPIVSTILSEENRKLFQNQAQKKVVKRVPTQEPTRELINSSPAGSKHNNIPSFQTKQKEVPMKNIIDNSFQPKEISQSYQSTATKERITQSISHPSVAAEINDTLNLTNLDNSQYQKLSNNNSSITKTHTAFLQARQEFSQQMSEIIQLQLACAENLLNQ
ncbi:MAG: PfaB family protein [Hassallia sp.]